MNGKDVAIFINGKCENSKNGCDVSVRIHQQVFVILRQELLDELVASFVY